MQRLHLMALLFCYFVVLSVAAVGFVVVAAIAGAVQWLLRVDDEEMEDYYSDGIY